MLKNEFIYYLPSPKYLLCLEKIDLNRSAFVISALLMNNPRDLVGGTSDLVPDKKSTADFIRTQGSFVSSLSAPINEMLIRERKRVFIVF